MPLTASRSCFHLTLARREEGFLASLGMTGLVPPLILSGSRVFRRGRQSQRGRGIPRFAPLAETARGKRNDGVGARDVLYGVAKRASLLLLFAVLMAPALRAEYVVLRNGQRLHVTGYQLIGDKYRLQMAGGSVEIAAQDVAAIEPEEVFTPVSPPAQLEVKGPYREIIEAAAARYNVDADLITSVIAVESNFDPKAVSRKNARGLMQLLPETAALLQVRNIEDPKENIEAGTRYLSELLKKYNNDLALALAAYNAGPEKVQLYGRVPPFAETVSYVKRVKQNYQKSKENGSQKPVTPPGGTAATSLPRPNQAQ